MLTAFQVCFLVGLGIAVISFITGHLFGLFGVDGLDFDLFGVDLSLPLSPTVYILGITVFGGIGWILMENAHPLPVFLIILIAAGSGLAASFLFYKGIVKPLRKAENTSAPETEELIGLLAAVTEAVPENGYGEITYVIHGNSFAAPAKSIGKEAIAKGTEVSICWIDQHVFYVTPLSADGETGLD